MVTPFNTIVSTIRDCFRRFGMRQHGWRPFFRYSADHLHLIHALSCIEWGSLLLCWVFRCMSTVLYYFEINFQVFLVLFEVSLCFYYWYVTGFWNQIGILISNTLRFSWFRCSCLRCLWFRCSWLLYRSKLVTNIETLLCLTLWRSQAVSVLVQGSVNPTSKAIYGEQCLCTRRIVFWDVTL